MDLVEEVFRLSGELPSHQRFELASQLRRAAVSIPSNIAEGYARESRREYVRYLVIARASLAEMETQLLIVVRVGYLPRDRVNDVYRLQREVGAMLTTLIRRLQSSARGLPR